MQTRSRLLTTKSLLFYSRQRDTTSLSTKRYSQTLQIANRRLQRSQDAFDQYVLRYEVVPRPNERGMYDNESHIPLTLIRELHSIQCGL